MDGLGKRPMKAGVAPALLAALPFESAIRVPARSGLSGKSGRTYQIIRPVFGAEGSKNMEASANIRRSTSECIIGASRTAH